MKPSNELSLRCQFQRQSWQVYFTLGDLPPERLSQSVDGQSQILEASKAIARPGRV